MIEANANALPEEFEVRLRGDVWVLESGGVLVGGSPARAVRLSQGAQRALVGSQVLVRDPTSQRLARLLLDRNLADPVLDHAPTPAHELTIVVPVHNRALQLERCLAALGRLPIIVVDDASSAPAEIAAVARRHGASLLRIERNVGPAEARNAGLRSVSSPLVAFVDSDVEVEGGDLLRLARHFRDPLVALVGPRVTGSTHDARPRWFERYDVRASSLDLGSTGGLVQPGAAVGWLPAACLVGRVSHLRGVGGFAAELRVAEDVDLVWRLVDHDFSVRYDPSIIAGHQVRTTLGSWLGRKFVYGTGGAELANRHGDKVAPAALSVISGLGAAAVLQRRWWSIPVAFVAISATARSLHAVLPVKGRRTFVSVRLSMRGLYWSIRQEGDLLLRHWWPLTLLGATRSASVRRAVASAVVVDLYEFCRERGEDELIITLLARRLDDAAYGAGLWWGALRHLSSRCLIPRFRQSPRGFVGGRDVVPTRPNSQSDQHTSSALASSSHCASSRAMRTASESALNWIRGRWLSLTKWSVP